MQKIVFDLDDLEAGKGGIDCLLKVKEHFPKFKCTCFTVPVPHKMLSGEMKFAQYKEWAEALKKEDWIEVAPHGNAHQGPEMMWTSDKGKKRKVTYKDANLFIDVAESTFKQLDLPYSKIWKSPFWMTSDEAYRALRDRGYTVAIDPNQPDPEIKGMKTYKYNWSIEKKMPLNKIVKGHGHMTTTGNSIIRALDNVLTMPTNAEFLTVSEYLKQYG